MAKNRLVLLFSTPYKKQLLDQLDQEIDNRSMAGQHHTHPDLVFVSKEDWILIEAELALRVSDYVPRWHRINPETAEEYPPNSEYRGYNALIYRNVFIVILEGDNLAADWIKANNG